MRLKNIFFLLTYFLFLVQFLNAAEETSRGPLKISADETISRDKGKWIEAKGNVWIFYTLESEDVLESYSNFARFDDSNKSGELLGSPKAIWKRKDPNQPSITLTAERILLEIEKERLIAYGNVFVYQAGSTLSAEEVNFSNPEKKLFATGSRPEFNVIAPEHKTKISAEQITAWTDKKTIYFNGKVHGIINLTSNPQ